MVAEIDGVTVVGTPEEVAELLQRRQAASFPVTTGGNFPSSREVTPPPQPCGCGTTAGCQAHPAHVRWYFQTADLSPITRSFS